LIFSPTIGHQADLGAILQLELLVAENRDVTLDVEDGPLLELELLAVKVRAERVLAALVLHLANAGPELGRSELGRSHGRLWHFDRGLEVPDGARNGPLARGLNRALEVQARAHHDIALDRRLLLDLDDGLAVVTVAAALAPPLAPVVVIVIASVLPPAPALVEVQFRAGAVRPDQGGLAGVLPAVRPQVRVEAVDHALVIDLELLIDDQPEAAQPAAAAADGRQERAGVVQVRRDRMAVDVLPEALGPEAATGEDRLAIGVEIDGDVAGVVPVAVGGDDVEVRVVPAEVPYYHGQVHG
jgi:hypothetical protein